MILWDDGSRREELSVMWQRIFHDTKPYTEYYFDEIYGKNEVILEILEEDDIQKAAMELDYDYEEDEEFEDLHSDIRGMLHLNPYVIQKKSIGDCQDFMKAHYIVGVSTEKRYRRKGIMRKLLKESFLALRQRGETFTYLMPADENYYLPFAFRFGMQQYIQEFETGSYEAEDHGYEVFRSAQIDPEEYVILENRWKKEHYGLSTIISKEYLERVEKEVRSEFGCFFYVKKEGRPIGRFVVYAEDDFLTISQLVCYSWEERSEFLKQIVSFCDDRYHFRSFRITYPEDWKDQMVSDQEFANLRIFTSKKIPVIMFRILRLEDMGRWLEGKEEYDCILQVQDADIPEQEGVYRFCFDGKQVSVCHLQGEEFEVDGQIEISRLTERLFGNLNHVEEELPESFNEKAITFWKAVEAISPIDIPEIV